MSCTKWERGGRDQPRYTTDALGNTIPQTQNLMQLMMDAFGYVQVEDILISPKLKLN